MARLRHFVIQGTTQRQDYVSTARGSGKFKTSPPDGRVAHGTRLADEVRQAATEIRQQAERAADAIPSFRSS